MEELKAHKFLLALASPYFHQIFFATGGDNSGQVVALNVENTSKEALEETINFMYNHPLRLHHASLATLFHMVDLTERFVLPSLRQLLDILSAT